MLTWPVWGLFFHAMTQATVRSCDAQDDPLSAIEAPPRPALICSFFMIHNLAMRIGDRLTAPIGLTSARWLLLAAIDRRPEPPTITALSADAMNSVQNTSRMLASMEKEGLVRRTRRKGAGRAVFVALTGAGRTALDATEELGERFHNEFVQGVAPDDIAELDAKLQSLLANLERFEASLSPAGSASHQQSVSACRDARNQNGPEA